MWVILFSVCRQQTSTWHSSRSNLLCLENFLSAKDELCLKAPSYPGGHRLPWGLIKGRKTGARMVDFISNTTVNSFGSGVKIDETFQEISTLT